MSSRMRSSSYLKPPLPKSPIRPRSRSSTTLQTPPEKLGLKKPGRRLSHGDMESKLPIEYSKMVEREFGEEEKEDMNLENLAADSAPVFERGRFYEEYSAKRNERLKRKNVGGGGGGDDDSVVKGTNYNLGVEPITTKRRGTAKKKTTTVETTATKQPRYSLRSMTKENNKPPLPVNVATVTSAKMKSVTTMRAARRI